MRDSSESADRASRLVQAAARLVAQEGIAAATARAVASAAGVSPSAINYNLGGMERLLSSAFALGAQEASDWLAARAREVAMLPPGPDGAARALEHVLIEWTGPARPLALLYQEAVAEGVGLDWTRAWASFWRETAQALDLPPIAGRALHAFFESEALYHLSPWSPALERAVLRDMVDHFAAVWLDAPARPEAGALLAAERAAGARPHGSVPLSAMRIAAAAAEVVEEKGLAGLTHRAVAARAGVTTGAVTHYFRTVEDLVGGAIRGQVAAMEAEAVEAAETAPHIDEVLTLERLREVLTFHARAERPASPVLRRRRLFLAALRRADLAGAGAVIRYSHGGTLRDSLGRVTGRSAEEVVLAAGVASRLLSAIWFACRADNDPAAGREALADWVLARLR